MTFERPILSVDPGGTTGFARWEATGQLSLVGQARRYSFLRLASDWLALDHEAPPVVVCESYVVTAATLKKSRNTDSLEIIGALDWLAAEAGADFVLQSPADAKALAKDPVLARLGYRQPSTLDHANDAIRHLVLYLARAGEESILAGLAAP